MTLFRHIICAKVEGFCTKKVLIYVSAVSCIVILLVAALVVVYFTKWANKLEVDLDDDDWDYEHQDNWPNLCTTSRMQSPVPLNQRFAYKQELPPIKLENFGNFSNVEVKNNGHTFTVTLANNCNCSKPKLSGGLLTQNYTMENLHFHWPSEHTIDNLAYDLEAHFVFFADKYGSFLEAMKYPHGMAVIAVLFAQINYTASNNFKILADAAKLVSLRPDHSTIAKETINLYDFLPYDHEPYFAYMGSLTTPSCAEYVDWMLFKNHSNIAYLDYKDLTTLYDHRNNLLIENNRSLQNLNDRTVYLQDTGV